MGQNLGMLKFLMHVVNCLLERWVWFGPSALAGDDLLKTTGTAVSFLWVPWSVPYPSSDAYFLHLCGQIDLSVHYRK